jgi:hypothetical protein
MSTDDRDVLELLQSELEFVEQGGYGRTVRTPWQPKTPLQDSLTCINYPYHEKVHPCSECHLIDFVPGERRAEQVPCQFIPLDASGETIDELMLKGNQHQLEEKLKVWLRARIKEIETSRAATQWQLKVSEVRVGCI